MGIIGAEAAHLEDVDSDVKRAVFCILHTSSDFMDAYQKLCKLGLKGEQAVQWIEAIMPV